MTLTVGSRVYLRGFRHGVPGVVVRIVGTRATVLWRDLGPTYTGRHQLKSLVEVEAVEAPCCSTEPA